MCACAVSNYLDARAWPRMAQQLCPIGLSVRVLPFRKPAAPRRNTIDTKWYGMLMSTKQLVEQGHAFCQPRIWVWDWRKIPGRHDDGHPRRLLSKRRCRDDLEEIDQLYLLWCLAGDPFGLGLTDAVASGAANSGISAATSAIVTPSMVRAALMKSRSPSICCTNFRKPALANLVAKACS